MERLNAIPRADFVKLIDLPNVGRAFASDLQPLGIERPLQLVGRDPFALFEELCKITKHRHDPCVIDQFIAVIRFMEGEEAKHWWDYTPVRKQELEMRAGLRPT